MRRRGEVTIELRHVTSFLALAEELHFGRAAARLHLTQPSLSQHLKLLERAVGVRLVARTSHDVRLTSAGQAFEIEARALVRQVRKAETAAREAAAGRSGTIKVGYNFPAGQHVLPATLARMQAEYPDVTVVLQEMRTGPQLAALASGVIDVALVYGRPAASSFECRKLMQLPVVALVGPGHRWAGRPGVPCVELARQPCILFERGQSPAMYDAIHGAAEAAGIVLDVAHIIDDPGAIAILVSIKPLIGFASATRGMLAGSVGGAVRPMAVPLYDPVPTIDLHAAWRCGSDSPLLEAFLGCLDAVAPFENAVLERALARPERRASRNRAVTGLTFTATGHR